MASIILRQSNVISDPSATIKGAPLSNAEVDNNFANINISIGVLSQLATQQKSNIVVSINEVTANVGILSNLQTSNTSNLVSAVNEVRQNVLASISVGSSRLEENSVTTAKILDGSITESKIADGNVSLSKLSDNSVSTSKILDGNVITTKLSDGAVTTSKIADANVTTAKLSVTGVSAALYGNATRIPMLTVGVDGRITSVSNVDISGSGFTGLNADNFSSGTLSTLRGGTGINSYITGDLPYASSVNTLSKLPIGASGQVLTVLGGIPVWQSPVGSVSSVNISGESTGLSFTGGPITSSGTINLSGTLAVANGGTGKTSAAYCDLASNVFGVLPINNGGTGSSSTAYCSLTTNVSGVLGPANGGTNQSSWTTGQILYASATNTLAKLSIGTSGQFLRVSSSGVPEWAAVTGTGITQLSITDSSGSVGYTITSTAGSTITTTSTLSLAVNNQSAARSALGLGDMATQSTGSYLTSSTIASTYATISSLSGYVSASGTNNYSGVNTYNGGIVANSAYNFNSMFSNYSIYQSSSAIWFNTGQPSNPCARFYMPSSNQYFLALHNSLEVGIGHEAGSAVIGYGKSAGTVLQVYYNANEIRSSTDNTTKPSGGNWSAWSDSRLKENVVNYTKGLESLLSLRPVNFNFNDVTNLGKNTDHKTFVGLIAQEVEETPFSNIVSSNADGYKTVNSSELTFALINAVKELKQEIDALKSEINALKNT